MTTGWAGKTANEWKRINLEDHAKRLRKLEKRAREAYRGGSLLEAAQDLAACHAAAALIYETELSRLGK